MKKLYTLVLCALSILTLSASAQTYSGGTYSTVLPGNWHTASGPGIWSGAEPPSTCNNCLIILGTPGTVNLNANVTLTNGSKVLVSSGTTLAIGNSGASTFAASYSIILTATGNNTLQLEDNTAKLDATAAGFYDGVLASTISSGSTYSTKEFGNPYNSFIDDAFQNQGPAVFGATAVGPVTLSGVGTLPIILLTFNAVLNDGQVDLTWTTSLESNSDHFAVERSTDAGSTWTSIGTVAAAGNSSTAINYSFTDAKPAQGTSEYRLELVDKDGRYAYSPVKSIRTGIVSSVSIYPNPARDYVNVTLGGSSTETVLIRLFNQSGQILLEKNVSNAGGTTVPLAVSSYPEGNYIIVVTGADGSKQVNKLLIAK